MTESDIEQEVIRNPRICIIGGLGSSTEAIRELLKAKNIDLVEIPEQADATVEAGWVAEHLPPTIVIDHLSMIDNIPDCTSADYDDGKQHWRGGKPGRKGKIKYERR